MKTRNKIDIADALYHSILQGLLSNPAIFSWNDARNIDKIIVTAGEFYEKIKNKDERYI